MTEVSDRVAAACPSCSPGLETVHEVLATGGGRATLRCTGCGHVHKEHLPEESTVGLDVVVSQEGESFPARTDAPAEETLAVGEEFVLEAEEAIMTVRITDLELSEGRVDAAPAEDVRTVWTRAVGNVAVDVTLHPESGAREETRSVTLRVPGDYEFTVDGTDELGDHEFTVEGVAVRDDATGYDHTRLDHPGDTVVAKDIKRLYARDESTAAWSAW